MEEIQIVCLFIGWSFQTMPSNQTVNLFLHQRWRPDTALALTTRGRLETGKVAALPAQRHGVVWGWQTRWPINISTIAPQWPGIDCLAVRLLISTVWQDLKNVAFEKEFCVLSFCASRLKCKEQDTHEGKIDDAEKTPEQGKSSPIFPK